MHFQTRREHTRTQPASASVAKGRGKNQTIAPARSGPVSVADDVSPEELTRRRDVAKELLPELVRMGRQGIELILAERGIVVTHESIRHWCLKFGTDFARRLRRRRPRPGDTWHLDDVFIRIRGVLHYLLRSVDQHAGRRLVHPPLPTSRSAARVPPHTSLRHCQVNWCRDMRGQSGADGKASC